MDVTVFKRQIRNINAELSGGEKQRIALARVLLTDAAVNNIR